MAGSMNSKNWNTYRKEVESIVSKNRHEYLMDADPEYVVNFEKFSKAESIEARQMYRKKMKVIIDKHGQDLKFKKSSSDRDKLIISCLPMVISEAKRYIGKSKEAVDIDDLIQAGNLGLVIAADRYINIPIKEGVREAKFSTVAYAWIKKYIIAESFRGGSVFGGDSLRKSHGAILNTIEKKQKTTSKDGQEFSNDVWDEYDMKNLDRTKEAIIAEDELKQLSAISKKLFDPLSKDEKRVLFMAYGIDTPNNVIYSQKEISKMIGKSEPTISRMMASALRKLTYSSKGSIKGEEMITMMCQIQGVDISQVEEWTMSSTF